MFHKRRYKLYKEGINDYKKIDKFKKRSGKYIKMSSKEQLQKY